MNKPSETVTDPEAVPEIVADDFTPVRTSAGDYSAVVEAALKLYDAGGYPTLGDAMTALGLDVDRAFALWTWETSKRLDGAPGAR